MESQGHTGTQGPEWREPASRMMWWFVQFKSMHSRVGSEFLFSHLGLVTSSFRALISACVKCGQ